MLEEVVPLGYEGINQGNYLQTKENIQDHSRSLIQVILTAFLHVV